MCRYNYSLLSISNSVVNIWWPEKKKYYDTSKKYIPFPTIFLFQLLCFFALALILLFFYMAFSEIVMIVTISISSFLIVVDLVVLLFSLTIWWNVPFIVDKSGISKKNQMLFWDKTVSIGFKSYISTMYGPVFVLIVITYSDG